MSKFEAAGTTGKEIPTDALQLGGWLLARLAQQPEWPMKDHHNFLAALSTQLSDASGQVIYIELPKSGTPTDFYFDPSPKIKLPCASNTELFGSIVDADFDLAIGRDEDLLNRGRELCAQCPVQTDCYTYGVSPPWLKDGLYGGKSKVERLEAWYKNLEVRAERLQHAYRKPTQQLQDKLEALRPEVLDEIASVLSGIGEKLQKRIEDEPKLTVNRLDPEFQTLLMNEAIIERATHLLSPRQLSVMRLWVDATKHTVGFYNVDSDAMKPLAQKAEAAVVNIVTELGNGAFNYAAWYYHSRGKAPESAVSLLTALRIPVPDGDIEKLKGMARDIVGLLSERRQRVKLDFNAFFSEHYALGDADSVSVTALTERYGMSKSQLYGLLSMALDWLRKRIQSDPSEEEE